MHEVAARVQKFMPHIAAAWTVRRRGGPDLPVEQAAMMTPKEVEQFIEFAKAQLFG